MLVAKSEALQHLRWSGVLTVHDERCSGAAKHFAHAVTRDLIQLRKLLVEHSDTNSLTLTHSPRRRLQRTADDVEQG